MTTFRKLTLLAAVLLSTVSLAQTITYANLEKYIPGEYVCEPDPHYRYNVERIVVGDDAHGRHVTLHWLNRQSNERFVTEWNHWEIKPLTKSTCSRGKFVLSQPKDKSMPAVIEANYRNLSATKWMLELSPTFDGTQDGAYEASRVSPLPDLNAPAPEVAEVADDEPQNQAASITPEPQRPVIQTTPLTQTEAQRLMNGTWDVRDVYDKPRYKLTIVGESARRLFDLQGTGVNSSKHLQYNSWSVTMPRPNAVAGTFHVLNTAQGLNTYYDYRNLTATIFEICIDDEWLIARKVSTPTSTTPAQPSRQQPATPEPPKQQGTVGGTILGLPVIIAK
ncbi:MAG: hypothetical protein IJ786_03975 [Bacteroidaceae bacterium]|nr:hypothetical protein [Bacteroidaceae bacterium]